MREIAPGVARLALGVVNAYMVGEPGRPWVLVDAGMPGFAPMIKAAAEARYGAGAKPEAIVLTHGHFDHCGSLTTLRQEWDVPTYAHHLEKPYLTGESLYPPMDPTVGGFFAFLSRFFPRDSYGAAFQLHELPSDGLVPELPGWEWFHTPGHSPGHVSLWRRNDRTLIVGDAFVTVDLSHFTAVLFQKPQLTPPPTPATTDWEAARRSVEHLAGLGPFTVATGHGPPMSGPNVARELNVFAEHFPTPAHGRYVPNPARADDGGVVSVPPPAPDPLPTQLAVGLGAATVAGALLSLARRRRQRRNTDREGSGSA